MFSHWEEKENVVGKDQECSGSWAWRQSPGEAGHGQPTHCFHTGHEARELQKLGAERPRSQCPNPQQCRASEFILFGFLSTDAAVSSNATPSRSSSINDISSMSTEQTLASDTDSSLDASTGPLEGCRWYVTSSKLVLREGTLASMGLKCLGVDGTK